MNVISHAVRFLLEHAIKSVQKSESKCFFSHSKNIIFERLKANKYGLKQNILFVKNMLWVLEIIT